MSVLDQEKVDRIKNHLKWQPRGMTITALSSKMKMNRNIMAKYLDMLLISGQVRMDIVGNAKVYSLSHRVPISAMLEFSSDLVIMLDSERKILQVNEPLLRLLNLERESLLGKQLEDTDNAFLRDVPVGVDIDAQEQLTEMSCMLNDEKRYFRIKQIPTAFEDGTQGVTLLIEDITPQMKYRLMLEMREETYRRIIEDQPELICRILPDFSITFTNIAFSRFFNIPYEAIRGTGLLSFFKANEAEKIRSCISSLTPKMAVTTCEVHAEIPFGDDLSYPWLAWTFHALFDDPGKLCEIQATGRDITKDKILEERRIREASDQKKEECERRYRTLGQHLNWGFYRSTADPDGRFVWGNTALINILGYNSMLELQGINVIELFTEHEMRMELLDELKRNGFVKKKILSLRRKDSRSIDVAVTAVAEFDDKGEIVFINGLVQDTSGSTPEMAE
ncbi:MAG: PAS domain-containing protein [Methanomicrobiaceae archaeon]|nr:PAS domain-containing protein [Methanomicrobiaceae archaeon]